MDRNSTTSVPGRRDRLTFKGNLKETRYGWLRLTPAYSVQLVADLLDHPSPVPHHPSPPSVLDPFCGTGTTALVCAERGIPCATTDINPFLIWLTKAKTRPYAPHDIDAFSTAAERVAAAIKNGPAHPSWTPPIHQIEKWWDPPTLTMLSHAMTAIRTWEGAGSDGVVDLLKIAFCRVMIECSHASFGHQSMSFKRNAPNDVADRVGAYGRTPAFQPRRSGIATGRTHGSAPTTRGWEDAVASIARAAGSPIATPPRALLCDARTLSTEFAPNHYDLVITSPPYPNRMSYIRELRPYMYWLGYLDNGRQAGELDWHAIGGTWGVATSNVAKWTPDGNPPLPLPGFIDILAAIARHSDLLSRYVHKYAADMTSHCRDLFTVVKPGAAIHYVVGNSKFYDVLLPVEQIFSALFTAAGFVDVEIRLLRKRTSKKELFEYLVSARKPGGDRMLDPPARSGDNCVCVNV